MPASRIPSRIASSSSRVAPTQLVGAGAGLCGAGAAGGRPAARTLSPWRAPPMGWNPWYQFHCDVNQALVEQTAQLMVKDGFTAAGYNYVNIDDCWMAPKRTQSGAL